MIELAAPPARATAASTVDHDRLDHVISPVAAREPAAVRPLHALTTRPERLIQIGRRDQALRHHRRRHPGDSSDCFPLIDSTAFLPPFHEATQRKRGESYAYQ